jgi:L-serine dehydratase
MLVSIFNDVIGPVMRGPSSSHCAAALRIGRLALDLMDGELSEVLVEFDRSGSLPTTHDTQGSDMGLFGGLMGWDAADERLPGSMQVLADSGVNIRIETVDVGDPHPNTYRLTLKNTREQHTLRAISTGGGMMEVIDVDGFAVSMSGDCFETLIWVSGDGLALREKIAALVETDAVLLHERAGVQMIEVKAQSLVSDALLEGLLVKRLRPVLPVMSRSTTRVPFGTCAEMLAHDAGRNTPLWKLAMEYECARGGLSEGEVLQMMVGIVRILRR